MAAPTGSLAAGDVDLTAAEPRKTINDGEQMDPAGPGTGTSVSSSTGANTYGAWTQINASVAEARQYLALVVRSTTGNNPTYFQAQIGTGAAASEVVRGTLRAHGNISGAADFATNRAAFLLPFKVAAGGRVAVRIADSLGVAVAYDVTSVYVEESDVEALSV